MLTISQKFFTNVRALLLDAQHQQQTHRTQHQHEKLERDLLERFVYPVNCR